MRILNHALSILKQHYDIINPIMEWIQNEPDKAVWKVSNNNESYILKSDFKKNHSFIPSIYLQYELSHQGLHVPEIIPTNQRKLCVKFNNRLYFLSRYIQGEPAIVSERTKAIGDFHQRASLPHSLMAHQNTASPLTCANEWIADYEMKINQMKMWEKDYSLQHIQPCIQLAEKCLKYSLERVTVLTGHFKKVHEQKWLVHGDLSHSNAISTKAGDIWIIDLEHSKVDSPVKDIRFLLPKIMLSSHYETYFSRFTIGRSFEELYYMDATFPHSLHSFIGGLIRQKRLSSKRASIDDVISKELHKDEKIGKLLKI